MPRSQRVLMIVENCSYPQDPRVRREANALASAGYRVSVIAPNKGHERWQERLDEVEVYRFPAPPSRNGVIGYAIEYGYAMSAIAMLSVWVLLRRGFDVVHVANPPDTLCAVAGFYKLLGKRFIYDHHDLCPELYSERFTKGSAFVLRVLIFFEKLSSRLADRIITTNESHKELLGIRHGIPSERISIVRNGPLLDRIREFHPDNGIRAKGKKILIYAGIIGFQDGLDCLCRALQHLRYSLSRTDFYCIILGDGDAMSTVRRLSEDLGLEGFIWFAGWISDREQYATYLASADICLSPEPSNSYDDRSTLIKITEYMAAGKPTVCFDLPESRFTAQGSAVYVAGNDERQFAQAIADLMDDPQRASAMGVVGQQRMKEELAWEYSVPHLLRAYEALVTHEGESLGATE